MVFSTLHTNSASQTIDRIIDSFPADQQSQVISQLASTLVGIISERLVPRIEGGRAPACEIMLVNSAIRNLIRERKVFQIDLVIETGMQEGMMSLNRSLSNLVRKKKFLWRMPNFTRLIRGIEDTFRKKPNVKFKNQNAKLRHSLSAK